jgi:hypothetical protein
LKFKPLSERSYSRVNIAFFWLNSTTLTFLNPINNQRGNACVPGKLRLTHEEFLSYFSDRIVTQNTLCSDPPNEDRLALFLLASGDPFINGLFVKSPDPANLDCRDFTFLGQLLFDALLNT